MCHPRVQEGLWNLRPGWCLLLCRATPFLRRRFTSCLGRYGHRLNVSGRPDLTHSSRTPQGHTCSILTKPTTPRFVPFRLDWRYFPPPHPRCNSILPSRFHACQFGRETGPACSSSMHPVFCRLHPPSRLSQGPTTTFAPVLSLTQPPSPRVNPIAVSMTSTSAAPPRELS